MIASVRAAGRLSVFCALVVVMMPIQMLALALGWRLARRLPRICHRWTCRIMGLKLAVSGTISTQRATLFVANHASYLDIVILGSLIEASFIAKAEVARWPVFGGLAKLQRSLFITRDHKAAAENRDRAMARLQAGDSLILFPEGTTSDGNRVLPFKSAAMAMASIEIDGQPVMVQPVSVAYTLLDGLPLGRRLRPFFAWYGDMTLAGHLWCMAGLGTLTVEVRFHEPVSWSAFGTRKALTRHCQDEITQAVATALSGRGAAAPPLRAPPAALPPAPLPPALPPVIVGEVS